MPAHIPRQGPDAWDHEQHGGRGVSTGSGGEGGAPTNKTGDMAKTRKETSAKFSHPSSPATKAKAWDKENGGWKAKVFTCEWRDERGLP